MKKVLFKKFTPSTNTVTGGIDKDFINEGIFLQWGLDSDEGASYTVALVQTSDGLVECVVPSRIKFIEPYTI